MCIIMELYKRIKQLSKQVVGSEAKLAAILGLRQNQFNGYLNPTSQRNLWEHLPAMLEAFPHISRDWLYFDEGNMLTQEKPAPESAGTSSAVSQADLTLQRALDEIVRLNEENRELRKRLDASDSQLEK